MSLLDAVEGDKRFKGLIVGALRRLWHRHPTRLEVLNRRRMEIEGINKDGTPRKRPHVFYTCCKCHAKCKQGNSKKYPKANVDHIDPVIPLVGAEALTWDELIKRMFTTPGNLQVLCTDCHTEKTKVENAIRRTMKNEA